MPSARRWSSPDDDAIARHFLPNLLDESRMIFWSTGHSACFFQSHAEFFADFRA
jgi:hypothetical protein